MTPSRSAQAQENESSAKPSNPASASEELSPEDQKKVTELKARDREVRAHEQAHLAAAGQYAKGGATYTYERGPDRNMYAVAGEVSVDTSKINNDPVATLRKAEVIRRAALAPANPSSQDRKVAAEATQMANEAQAEIAAERAEEFATSTAKPDHENTGKIDSTSAGESDQMAACPSCGGRHSVDAHDGMIAYSQTSAGFLDHS